MNVAKNMEFIFVAAIVVAVGVSNAFAAPVVPAPGAAKAAIVKASAPVATVVVTAKRLGKGKYAA